MALPKLSVCPIDKILFTMNPLVPANPDNLVSPKSYSIYITPRATASLHRQDHHRHCRNHHQSHSLFGNPQPHSCTASFTRTLSASTMRCDDSGLVKSSSAVLSSRKKMAEHTRLHARLSFATTKAIPYGTHEPPPISCSALSHIIQILAVLCQHLVYSFGTSVTPLSFFCVGDDA